MKERKKRKLIKNKEGYFFRLDLCMYLTTSPYWQDVTQGHFITGLNSELSFS